MVVAKARVGFGSVNCPVSMADSNWLTADLGPRNRRMDQDRIPAVSDGRTGMADTPEVTARRVLDGGERIGRLHRPQFFSTLHVRQHVARASL
jgi:hypothetical protein